MDFWAFEKTLLEGGPRGVPGGPEGAPRVLAGVDEAGRGPLAGPVCAAAVVLPWEADIPGLDDSKKLTEKKRETLFDVIRQTALDYGIGWASVEEIDELNILNATYLAMNRALRALKAVPDMTVIDGNRCAGIEVPCVTLVGGDGLSANVAAASVLAKVSRDRYMKELAARYPGYGFEKHKGYGTKDHYAAIRALGPSPVHRTTFLRKPH